MSWHRILASGSLWGCTGDLGPEVGDFLIDVGASEAIPAVAVVSWTTGEPGVGWVEYGPDENFGFSTVSETTAATEHRIAVVGVPAASAWNLRAHTQTDAGELVSAAEVFSAGSAPVTLPNFEVQGERSDEGWVLTTVFGDTPYIALLDDEGRYSWWFAGEHDEVYTRTRLSLDKSAVVFNAFAEDRGVDASSIYRVSLDGTNVTEIATPDGHHDFVELPEGGYAYFAIDVREYEGRSIVGDSLVEISADGTETIEVWNAWNVWTPPDEHMSENFYPQGEDWLHCNTIEYDENERAYYVSVRNLNALLKIDRDSGEILWQLGGDQSDFALTAGTAFAHQHSPLVMGDELLVFDNRESGNLSYARGYDLNVAGGTYAESWTREGPQGNWVALLGDIQRFENGNTLMAWGTAGFLNELNSGDEEIWRMDVEFGNVVGFFEGVDQVGGPMAP
jgi:hypothetical protein